MSDERKLRDEIAEDYRNNLRRMGHDAPFEDVQRLAKADLELVDAYERQPKPYRASKPSKLVEEPRREPSPAEVAAMDIGGRFVRREIPKDPVSIETLNAVNKDRRKALVRRVAELMARNVITRELLFPDYAEKIAREHANWTLGTKGYRQLNPIDRDRRFYRAMEDIADKSNGVIGLGPWWVK